MIVDDKGSLVAFPEINRMLARKNGEQVTLNLNELGDPVLERAHNRFLIEKAGHRELVVNEKIYINTVSSLRPTAVKTGRF